MCVMVTKPTDNDTQFTLPDPSKAYEAAGAMFQGAAWVHEQAYRQSPDVIAAAEALGQKHEPKITAADIEAIAQEVRTKCAGAPQSEIEAIIRGLQNNIGTSRRNLDDMKREAISAADKLAADVKQEATETSSNDINAMHKELYANDAVYRQRVNEARQESDRANSEFNQKQDKLDTVAKDKNYTTSFDKERTEVEEKIKELEAKGGEETPELIAARLKRLELIEKQRKEIEKQARERGDKETETLYSDHEHVVREQRELQTRLLEKLKEEMLKAERRALEASPDHLSEEQIRKRMALVSSDLDKRYTIDNKSGQDINALIKEANAALDQTNSNHDKIVANPGSPEIQKLIANHDINKLPVQPDIQTVSPAETVPAQSTPANGKPVVNLQSL